MEGALRGSKVTEYRMSFADDFDGLHNGVLHDCRAAVNLDEGDKM
jgi:hypothetical protein